MAEVASRFERARVRVRRWRRAVSADKSAGAEDPVDAFEKHLEELEESFKQVKAERDTYRRERDELRERLKKYEG